MALKQDFTKQVESQIAVWQAQIKNYQGHLTQAGAEISAQAQSEYAKALEGMRQNADRAGKLLNQARDASDTAWKDMPTASGKALAQLQQGWADALKRFQ